MNKMKLLLTVTVLLYISAPAFSKRCKTLPEVDNFSFEELLGKRLSYYLVPVTDEYRQYDSATETTMRVGADWYTVFSANNFNGDQVNYVYKIDQIHGSKLVKTLMVDGQMTKTTVTLEAYAYEPDLYVLFYACSPNEEGIDYRYGVLFHNSPMTSQVAKKMFRDDMKFNFDGLIYPIGSDYLDVDKITT